MSSSIIKEKIPTHIIFNFLSMSCAEKDDDTYTFDVIAYNKAKFLNLVDPLCSRLKFFYYPSKHHFLTRTLNYAKFTTILRQIFRYNQISYDTIVNYRKSNYQIAYKIDKQTIS